MPPSRTFTGRGDRGAQAARYAISPGTLYPTLHRLEADGLLSSRQEVVEGRVRRIYRATKAGMADNWRIAGRCWSWHARCSPRRTAHRGPLDP
ncbi:PadR family transcriptional regulator [Nonomuraea jiangxiensis]|uniref:PadR family transcriptional regulator n=1 Tax=Nonomuraea jiangxiensis TaxID=633440 RepID=UPI000AA93220|nr:PadR family transcriptional regulator [Nonomuraea jiangxiensis]